MCVCVCIYTNICINVYSCIYFIYVCVYMNVYAHSHSYMRSSPLVLATWLFASLETSSIAVLTLHRPTSCSSIATQDMLVLEELQ